MSQEIRANLQFTVNNGGYQAAFPYSAALNQAAIGSNGGVATLTTTATAVPVGGVTSVGWLLAVNLDATNSAQLGPKPAGTFYPFAKIAPGELAVFKLDPAGTYYWQSTASTVQVQFLLLQA